MSTTTESASTQTKTKKEGVQIKGRDVIYLNAPEICFPENAPLKNTEKRELYAILDELFQSGSGGGDEEWQPPEWWIPVPDAESYDIYILILAMRSGYSSTDMNFELILGRELDNGIGYGNITCDWGDGIADNIIDGYLRHTYTEEGQYLVHIVADENTNCWRSSGSNQAAWQIVKTGEKIAFVTDYNENNGYYPYGNLFPNKNYLKWVQINHSRGLPTSTKDSLFQNCFALRKLELKKKISGDIAKNTFQNCCGLSDVKKILNGDEIKSIGDYAFQGCYNLQEIVVAENCTFGNNCFANCYSLYPRPDGSTD